MAAASLTPEQSDMLTAAAMGGPHESRGRALPRAGNAHPLDGLSAAEIRQLFAGTGLSPERYLPADHPASGNTAPDEGRGR